MFAKPTLALCSDRQVKAKSHPTSGSPELWFDNAILNDVDLFGISFDFFVNWGINPPAITPVIWVKLILEKSYNYTLLLSDLNAIMTEELGSVYLSKILSFGRQYNLKVQFVIFNDEQNWNSEASEICIVEGDASNLEFNGEVINMTRFKTIIQEFSGGPINIGGKGLFYGTSRLECALSTTNSLYPGDLDLLILNDKNEPNIIFEFKKHTKLESISGQKLSNYYPNPDGRKYNRLALFRDYLLRGSQEIPMLIIYYPTSPSITEWKLELLEGSINEIKTKSSKLFPLPNKEYKSFGKLTRDIITKFYKL